MVVLGLVCNGRLSKATSTAHKKKGHCVPLPIHLPSANGATLVCIYQLLPVGTSVNGMPLSIRGS